MMRSSAAGTNKEQDSRDEIALLVAAAISGSDDAWAALHARFTPLLRAVAGRFRMGAADTEEAVQATWVKCFENLSGIREPQALTGWLVTICRRECLSLLSRGSRCRPTADDSLSLLAARAEPAVGQDRDPADVLVHAEMLAGLRAAVVGLPERQRLLIGTMLRLDGEGYAKVAADLAMPVGSIGPTRQRAVSRLRESLAPLAA